VIFPMRGFLGAKVPLHGILCGECELLVTAVRKDFQVVVNLAKKMPAT